MPLLIFQFSSIHPKTANQNNHNTQNPIQKPPQFLYQTQTHFTKRSKPIKSQMGSSQSFQKHETMTPPSCNGNGRLGSLGELPECCVAMVLMNLEPTEICKFAGLNRAFRGAASADFVWEKKLPGNYHRLIERVFDERNDNEKNMCKRDVYALLCGCNSIDDGTKQVWLDVNTGGICLAISAKGLTITGIDDRRYWNHIPSDESRFSTVAYLQQIWWFEVIGEVEFPFPAGTYSVFFQLQSGRTFKRFGRRQCNTEHVHGWDKKPVHFLLCISDGQKAVSQCFIKEPGKWINYHVGDFVVKNSYETMKLKFSMTQIDCTHTKGGLCVDSVMIYPKTFTERLKQF